MTSSATLERHDMTNAPTNSRGSSASSTLSLKLEFSTPQESRRTSSTIGLSMDCRVDQHGVEVLVIDWDGPEDPQNPRNWNYRRKWEATVAVSLFAFISPVSSSMIAPATEQIAEEFDIRNSVTLSMVVSSFVLAYAIGPLFLSPLSEVYGRSRVLQIANLIYLAFNLACAFSRNTAQLIAFRFLAGLGGSASLSVGGGVLSDMFAAKDRGKAFAIYALAPLVGPVVGPIAGAWISQTTTWRWVFRSLTIADVVIQLFGLCYLEETYAPVLLERKAAEIGRKLLDPEKQPQVIQTIYQTKSRVGHSWRDLFGSVIVRPCVLFMQEPIIQLFGIYLAVSYGTVYLTLTTIPGIYGTVYHQDVGIAGLHYIALVKLHFTGVGFILTSQLNLHLLDRVYVYYQTRNNGIGKPEYRLPVSIPMSLGLPLGLLITGWGAQEHVHWIIPDIGFVLIAGSIVTAFQTMQTYIVDAFTLYSASALAAVSFLRSIVGFAFPLFAPNMYLVLGYGKGNTILSAISFVMGPPMLCIFWIYGEQIRNLSRRAKISTQGLLGAQASPD